VEVPVDVAAGLASVRQTLHVRWNPTAQVVGERSFDVNGNARELSHEPRWELWDRDELGVEYKVATLDGPDGGFLPLGTWVLELVALINPANYDGDVHRMVEALIDKPNADVARLGEKCFEQLTEYLADLSWSGHNRGSRVVVPSTFG
jgi:hypothetical protein